jgi:predicted nucleic acid-binding protein
LETEAKLYIQQGIIDGVYELVWSYILEAENNHNLDDDIRKTVKAWKSMATISVTENEQIILYAEKLGASGIKPKDALHVACAVYSESDYLFTTDRRLANKQGLDIRIINPLEFIGLEV